ncbi:MAG TPA: hypothetical protein P5253_02080 [bacterium]|nr:hypothetical protein [bacterium]HRR91050.1 hypothetical protein [bacterium]
MFPRQERIEQIISKSVFILLAKYCSIIQVTFLILIDAFFRVMEGMTLSSYIKKEDLRYLSPLF